MVLCLSLFTITFDRNVLLLTLSAGTMLVIVYDCFLCFLLFVHCVFITIHTVIQIYVCCNNLYAHCSPYESMVWGSAARTVDGNLKVRSPVFDLVLSLDWVRP